MGQPKVTRQTRSESKEYKSRPKKRKQTFNPKTVETDTESYSASAKKIKLLNNIEVPQDPLLEYKILNFITVFTSIANVVKCRECDGDVEFQTYQERGLGFKVAVICKKCKPTYIPSSPFVGHTYEINRRFIFIMRLLGLGWNGCTKFCGLMDMSPFLDKKTYYMIIENMRGCIDTVCEKVFLQAVKEEKEETCKQNNLENASELTVSGDGTWMKPGFHSLYGVASLIGYYSKKIIDLSVKSLYCKSCEIWKKKLDVPVFEAWYEEHKPECSISHEGSSGKMEVDSMVEMFKRSDDKYAVKYKNYVGDGDSKTYTNVVKSHPYGENFQIVKKECIGHVQKRMGTRLRDLLKNTTQEVKTKSDKVVKKKVLGGKGRLTAKMIDKLTTYYGLAIRRNCQSVEQMRNAIWATFFHYSSTNDNPQHEKCPVGNDSWCEYQQAAAKNELELFEHSYDPLPDDVLAAIKPIYEDLSSDTLLERCVGGFNQNNNESYNALIWRISPKKLPGSSTLVSMAAKIAACTFNEGSRALLSILYSMGVKIGRNARNYAQKSDEERVNLAELQAQLVTREERTRRRQQQIDALDVLHQAEGLLYGPGIDDDM